MNLSMKTVLNATMAVVLISGVSNAATINFSSLETVLADPDDTNSKMSALWTGWATQVYEYNMPFIELGNEADAPFAIESFTMTIGDTNYQFSNEFFRKEDTNSYPFPANGDFALTGFSTPNVDFTATVEDGGDTLVIDFGPDGLAPGEVIRFQVDIDPDADAPDAMLFADYTSVFFRPDNSDDNSGNSTITLDFIGPIGDDGEEVAVPQSILQLPNLPVSGNVAQFLRNPRPYSVMQPIDVFPDTEIPQIPEPTTVVLLSLAAAAGLARRRNG